MKKVLIITVTVIAVVILVLFGLRMYTKSHSPSETVKYGELLEVTYSRPFKKDREIFGGLVPYGNAWRTGANEATILTVSSPVSFGGKNLETGSYTLWTVPGQNSWKIILNSQTGQWGVSMDGIANRAEEDDVLEIEVPVINTEKVFEQFTIAFEEVKDGIELVIVWDKTMVAVPISKR